MLFRSLRRRSIEIPLPQKGHSASRRLHSVSRTGASPTSDAQEVAFLDAFAELRLREIASVARHRCLPVCGIPAQSRRDFAQTAFPHTSVRPAKPPAAPGSGARTALAPTGTASGFLDRHLSLLSARNSPADASWSEPELRDGKRVVLSKGLWA